MSLLVSHLCRPSRHWRLPKLHVNLNLEEPQFPNLFLDSWGASIYISHSFCSGSVLQDTEGGVFKKTCEVFLRGFFISFTSEAEKMTTAPIYPQTQTLVCIVIHDSEHFSIYILVISLGELLVVTLFSYRGHMTLGSPWSVIFRYCFPMTFNKGR